jgi:murein DD-endopeptidase MepM/ murein hydrolase activator NlpD
MLHPVMAVLAIAPCCAMAEPLRPPVQPACISSPFGWRHAVGPHAPAAFHNGIDLPAPAGAVVRAVAAGTVLRIKRQGLGGVTVHVGHPDGTTALYAHLGNLVPAIAEGKRDVAAGEPLGHVARTGVTYGTHLFFAVLRGSAAVDPEPLLGVARCR